MVKLKFTRRLGLFGISLVGLLISVGIPVAFLVHGVYKHVDFEVAQKVKITKSFGFAGLMLLLILIYGKWIKKIFDRKMQAIAVVNELGLYGAGPVVVNRLLKTIEYMFPAATLSVVLYGLKLAFGLYPVFDQLFIVSIYFIALLFAGAIVFLVGDFIKISFVNNQIVDDALALEQNKNKLSAKRLKKGRRKDLEALMIEQELEKLKNN